MEKGKLKAKKDRKDKTRKKDRIQIVHKELDRIIMQTWNKELMDYIMDLINNQTNKEIQNKKHVLKVLN